MPIQTKSLQPPTDTVVETNVSSLLGFQLWHRGKVRDVYEFRQTVLSEVAKRGTRAYRPRNPQSGIKETR